MVENRIRKTNKVELDFNEGLRYAQWGLMRVYVGVDCPFDEWQEARSPKVKQNVFWLEEPKKNQRISPVFGLAEKEAS